MTEPRYRLSDFNTIPDRSILEIGPNGRQDTQADSWEPIDLSQLADKPPVQPTLGDLGLIYPGKRHVLSGPQESAKTLAAYIIGLQVIRTGHPIIIIDFEMGQWDARDRLKELGATTDELHAIHYIEPHHPATPPRITTLVELEPHLVIVDAAAGAYDLQGLDDNKRADVEKFTRIYVHQFWQAEIATIVLDHVVKNTDNRGSYAIGSERKVGSTDVHLGFQVISPIRRGGTGIYKLTTHKDRGGHLQRGHIADLHLTSHPDTHQITWELKPVEHDQDAHFRPTVLMQRVSTHLQQQDEPLSITKIKESVQGEDRYIGVAIDRLLEEDYASETPGPRGARMITHITLFTDQSPTPADPCATPAPQATTTPASPSMDAGVAGVTQQSTPASADIDVYDPKIQRQLDDDIPF